MIEITAEIRAFIDKAAAGVELAEDEYIDPSDGLIHCKKCGGQRQTVVPCFGKSGYFMPHCICQCQREAEEQRKAAEERQRRMERIKRRKAQGLQDRYLYDYTFSNDNRQNPLMDKAHAYVENWKEAYKSNIGLLLFGDVGTGKSFFAGCIANALLDQDVPVLMTNFPTILNRLTGMFSEDRSEFIASFDEIRKILGLTEVDCKKIFTINRLENKDGRSFFREVFIRRGTTSGVYGVEEPHECYMTYTTERAEKEALKLYKKELRCSHQEAIEAYCRDWDASGIGKALPFAQKVNETGRVLNLRPVHESK